MLGAATLRGGIEDRQLLGVAALVATVATVGSLWFSHGLGLVPCELCWYQRILMYPLVVVTGVAALEDRAAVWKSALPLSMLGAAIAAYHSYLQATVDNCALTGPCASVQWQSPLLGLTIPNLALVGFALVTLAVVAAAWSPTDS
jgi:disulfide bond formation protein DsbB